MIITVNELLSDFKELQVQLIAGEKGLHKTIDYMTVQEFSLKSERIHENGFIMTTFSGFDTMDDIIEHFKWYDSAKVSGVCFHTVLYQEIPRELVDLSNKLNIPLFRIPPNVPYHDLYKKYNRLLYRKANIMKNQIEDLNNHMLESLLLEKDINFVIHSVGKFIHEPVIYLDDKKKIVSLWGTNHVSRADILSWLESRKADDYFDFARSNRMAVNIERMEQHKFLPSFIVLPLYSKQDFYGYLIVGNEQKDFHFRDLLLKNTVTVIILDALKKNQTKEFLKNKDTKLLEEIFTNDEIDHIKLEQLFYDIRQVRMLFVIEPKESMKINDCYQAIEQYVKEFDIKGLIWIMGKHIIVVSQQDFKPEEAIGRSTTNMLIGMSGQMREASVKGIRLLYDQANIALHMAKVKKQPVCKWAELGCEKITYFMKDMDILKDYYEDYLLPLIDYDRQNNTQMIDTLYVYMKTFFSFKETGKILHLHYNTVKYRINKIQQYLNLPIDDSDNYMNIMMALKSYYYKIGSNYLDKQ